MSQTKKVKEVKHDKASFNADHYAGKSESEFIKDQLPGVPDRVGTDEQKKEWLKDAWKKVSGKSEDENKASTSNDNTGK